MKKFYKKSLTGNSYFELPSSEGATHFSEDGGDIQPVKRSTQKSHLEFIEGGGHFVATGDDVREPLSLPDYSGSGEAADIRAEGNVLLVPNMNFGDEDKHPSSGDGKPLVIPEMFSENKKSVAGEPLLVPTMV